MGRFYWGFYHRFLQIELVNLYGSTYLATSTVFVAGNLFTMLDKYQLQKRLNELKELKATLQAAHKEVEQKLIDFRLEPVDAERIQSTLKQFRELIQTATIERQRRLLRGL